MVLLSRSSATATLQEIIQTVRGAGTLLYLLGGPYRCLNREYTTFSSARKFARVYGNGVWMPWRELGAYEQSRQQP